MGPDKETRQFLARIWWRTPWYWHVEFWILYLPWLGADGLVWFVLQRAPHPDDWIATWTPAFLFGGTVAAAIGSILHQNRLRRLITEDPTEPIADQLEFLRLTTFGYPSFVIVLCFLYGLAAVALAYR